MSPLTITLFISCQAAKETSAFLNHHSEYMDFLEDSGLTSLFEFFFFRAAQRRVQLELECDHSGHFNLYCAYLSLVRSGEDLVKRRNGGCEWIAKRQKKSGVATIIFLNIDTFELSTRKKGGIKLLSTAISYKTWYSSRCVWVDFLFFIFFRW